MPSSGHILPSSMSLSPNCAGDRGEGKGRIPGELKSQGEGAAAGVGGWKTLEGARETGKGQTPSSGETGSSGVGKVIKELQA